MKIKKIFLALLIIGLLNGEGLVTFEAGTTAKASEVNANFEYLKNLVLSGGDVALHALGAKATASSYGGYDGYTALPEKTIDAITDSDTSYSFWCATSNPSWLKIELDKEYFLNKISIRIYYHSLSNLTVEFSQDSINWKLAVDKFNTLDTGDDVEDGEIRDFYLYDLSGNHTKNNIIRAKYIRINIGSSNSSSGHIYKSCISDVKVFRAL